MVRAQCKVIHKTFPSGQTWPWIQADDGQCWPADVGLGALTLQALAVIQALEQRIEELKDKLAIAEQKLAGRCPPANESAADILVEETSATPAPTRRKAR